MSEDACVGVWRTPIQHRLRDVHHSAARAITHVYLIFTVRSRYQLWVATNASAGAWGALVNRNSKSGLGKFACMPSALGRWDAGGAVSLRCRGSALLWGVLHPLRWCVGSLEVSISLQSLAAYVTAGGNKTKKKGGHGPQRAEKKKPTTVNFILMRTKCAYTCTVFRTMMDRPRNACD